MNENIPKYLVMSDNCLIFALEKCSYDTLFGLKKCNNRNISI